MSHLSSSRLEELIREALSLGADDLYFKGRGEGATLRYRVKGFVVEALNRQISDFADLVAQTKACVTEGEFEEDEWSGQFSLSTSEGLLEVQALWLREYGTEALALRIVSRSYNLDSLGLNASGIAVLEELISQQEGLILGCSPTGGGHHTTLLALLERLGQSERRVAIFSDEDSPIVPGVTNLDLDSDELADQLAILSGHFDVFAVGTLNDARSARAAINLAAEGHLVLGMCNVSLLTLALQRLLGLDISPEELQSHFRGGWSQTLVERANSSERIGIFRCLSMDTANQWTFEDEWLAAQSTNELRALWRDAEEKIEQGLTTSESVSQWLSPL